MKSGLRAAIVSIDTWADGVRSEEHTSELQSRLHLVCRLLLEKKKKHSRLIPFGYRSRAYRGLRGTNITPSREACLGRSEPTRRPSVQESVSNSRVPLQSQAHC